MTSSGKPDPWICTDGEGADRGWTRQYEVLEGAEVEGVASDLEGDVLGLRLDFGLFLVCEGMESDQ
jgi:hypothetical protein